MNAKLALRAMTLRGIGSYLHGARIEIKPITILCGTNGSGKSTWLRSLQALRDSLSCSEFPFRFVYEDADVYNVNFTNAFVHLSGHDAPEVLANRAREPEFGPPCTLGLEFEAAQSFELPEIALNQTVIGNELQEFLWSGKCSQGTRFRIRLSHPTQWSGAHVPNAWHAVELLVNGNFAIRFESIGDLNAQDDEKYSITCSAGFLPAFSAVDDKKELQLGYYKSYNDNVELLEGMLDESELRQLVSSCRQRIRELLDQLLSGFFGISAIRRIHDYKNLGQREDEDTLDPIEAVKKRYVGANGEATWWLERAFAYNRMKPIPAASNETTSSVEKYFTVPLVEGFVAKWMEELLECTIAAQEGSDESGAPFSQSSAWDDAPVGFLESIKPENVAVTDDYAEPVHDLDLINHLGPLSVERIVHKCFCGQPQGPRQMSSGFHQLAPLIVQSALMHKYEIMAVENPEVHLHPSLQLKVAEFLMHQAKSGKWMIIETHSDLIIRRVIREILEERIALGQANIGIYFASLDQSEQGYQYSTLKPIEIDERGRIQNWPPGFMDDDVKESRHLIDIMYGGPPDISEDEE